MRPGWVKKRLSDVTTKIGSGATPRGGNESYKAEGVSLIRSLNVYDDGFREAKLARIDQEQANALLNVIVEPQDVLLNITGASVARCCRAPAELLPARVNQHVSIIRPDREVLDSDFLHYLLISQEYKKRLLSTGEEGGSTRQAITKAQLQDFVIEFPESLPEQQRIVALLDEAFAGLATAKANAERNLLNAGEVFEAHLEAVIGSKQEGWEEKTLGELCTIARGGSPRPISEYLTTEPNGVNWVKISDATLSGKYIYKTAQAIKPEGVSRSRMVNEGDFILSNSMSFGRPYIMRTSGCIHDGWLVLSGYAPSLEQDYLYYVLGSGLVYPQFDYLAAGSTVRNLNIELASRVVLPVPPKEIQRAIVKRVECLSAETQRLTHLYEGKLAALEELKKSLLQEAFNGEL
jgi:type I restriction enzyme S subunit